LLTGSSGSSNSAGAYINLIGQANSRLHLAVLMRADMDSTDLSRRLVKSDQTRRVTTTYSWPQREILLTTVRKSRSPSDSYKRGNSQIKEP